MLKKNGTEAKIRLQVADRARPKRAGRGRAGWGDRVWMGAGAGPGKGGGERCVFLHKKVCRNRVECRFWAVFHQIFLRAGYSPRNIKFTEGQNQIQGGGWLDTPVWCHMGSWDMMSYGQLGHPGIRISYIHMCNLWWLQDESDDIVILL